MIKIQQKITMKYDNCWSMYDSVRFDDEHGNEVKIKMSEDDWSELHRVASRRVKSIKEDRLALLKEQMAELEEEKE